MNRYLGTLLALLLLFAAGCGDDTGKDDTSADDPSASGSPSPSDSATDPAEEGAVDFTEVDLMSETNAGGEVSQRPTVLDSPAAIEDFAAGVEGRLAERIETAAAAAAVPEGQLLVGAVVAIGCDVPPGVGVAQTPDGLEVTAEKVAKPKQECFAPVTSVALLTVDAGDVAAG